MKGIGLRYPGLRKEGLKEHAIINKEGMPVLIIMADVGCQKGADFNRVTLSHTDTLVGG
jgi:hypothetical protein